MSNQRGRRGENTARAGDDRPGHPGSADPDARRPDGGRPDGGRPDGGRPDGGHPALDRQRPDPEGPSIGDLGEFGLIAEMAARMRPGPGTVVGIGDDAAVLAAPDGRVVATTDFLLEGRHFRRDWAGPADIGHRAAVRSLADGAHGRAR